MAGTESEALRLLAVEDDPADQSWMMVLLEESTVCPYHISFVSTMADAEVSLTVGEVDCVLLDLSLPDSWGLESLKRTLAAAPTTPVVVITGQDDQELGLQAIEKGAHDYLVKGKSTGDAILRAARWAAARADSLDHGDATLISGTSIELIEAPWMCVTSDAAISQVNGALLSTLDRVEAEVLGAPIATFIAPQYLADTMRSLRSVISGGPPSMAIPSRLLNAYNATLPRVLTAMRVTGAESSLAYLFVVVTEPRPPS
jgi:CheY-like chemotaxis protein